MEITYKHIKGYNCPKKVLLLIDGEPIAFADSVSRILEMINYVLGHANEEKLSDKSIVGVLNTYKIKYKEAK